MAQAQGVDRRHGHGSWPLRLAAGALAGLGGGLAFGLVLSLPGVLGVEYFAGAGLLTQIARLTGTPHLHLAWVWLLHAVASIAFGLLFSVFVRPWGWKRTTAMAVGYAVALWLVVDFLIVRSVTGTPYAIDAAFWLDLAGHLLYGLGLGLLYPVLYLGEVDAREHVGEVRMPERRTRT